MRLLVLLLLFLFPSGLAVSYTVQVAALTDEQAARRLLSELREQGFPAYSVGLPTPSGQVYRLRVGVFANRAAAARYAELMAELTGFMPAPALAEDMPRDFVPLEPNLLRAFPYRPGATRAEILRWPDDMTVLRVQSTGDTPLEAEYYLLEEEESRRFAAWWLSEPEDGWVERVANFPLWPATYWDMDEAALREEQDARLAAIAQTLGLGPGVLEGFVMHLPDSGMPVLVLADRFHLTSRESRRYLAVGNPVAWQGELEGPPLVWLDSLPPDGFPSALPAPVLDVSSLLGREEEGAEETEDGGEDPNGEAAADEREEHGDSSEEPEEVLDDSDEVEAGEAADEEADRDDPREAGEDAEAAGELEGASEADAEADVELEGASWEAQSDNGFTRLVVQEGERLRSWRALVGEPLWLQGNYLLAHSEGELLLYLLRPPP